MLSLRALACKMRVVTAPVSGVVVERPGGIPWEQPSPCLRAVPGIEPPGAPALREPGRARARREAQSCLIRSGKPRAVGSDTFSGPADQKAREETVQKGVSLLLSQFTLLQSTLVSPPHRTDTHTP